MDTKQQARRAGLLYFVMALVAPIGLMYVPGEIWVSGDAAATAENFRMQAGVVRIGIASELIHQAIAIFLLLALYRLFKPVDEYQARLLLILGALVSVPIMFLNTLNDLAALMLTSGADWLTPFSTEQLDSLAYLFAWLHHRGVTVASVFWGLWLFPFGILVIRSGFIPRLLGYLLFVAGSAYLVNAFFTLIVPEYRSLVSGFITLLYMAEVPIIFWLLIWGAKPQSRPQTN
jgi:hypothetical protein